jgi:hypothetical protein
MLYSSLILRPLLLVMATVVSGELGTLPCSCITAFCLVALVGQVYYKRVVCTSYKRVIHPHLIYIYVVRKASFSFYKNYYRRNGVIVRTVPASLTFGVNITF